MTRAQGVFPILCSLLMSQTPPMGQGKQDSGPTVQVAHRGKPDAKILAKKENLQKPSPVLPSPNHSEISLWIALYQISGIQS